MIRQCFRHAWTRTFQAFGGVSLLLMAIAVPMVGFPLHYILRGPKEVGEEIDIWAIYGFASLGIVFSTVFTWNLVCAPYRLERSRRVKAENDVETFKRMVDASPRLPPGRLQPDVWSAWKTRSRFTLLEIAHLLAGDAPRMGPAEGAAATYLQELKWAVNEDALDTLPPGGPGSPRDAMQRLSRRIAFATGGRMPDVPDDEQVDAQELRAYLSERPDDAARDVLANLGGYDPSLWPPETATETQP